MKTLPLFPVTVPLDFSHQETIEEILNQKGVYSSDFALYNLLGWYFEKPALISQCEESLIIQVEGPDGRMLFLPPLSRKPLEKPLKALLTQMQAGGRPLELTYVPKNILAEIQQVCPGVEALAQRNDYDYLYLRKELAELAGRKFHQKKNFVNRILEEENPMVELLNEANQGEVAVFLEAWYQGFGMNDDSVKIEALAAKRMLPQVQHLGGLGVVVRIGGAVAGFSLASPVQKECWVVTLEKAEKSKKGLYQFVNWALVNRLPDDVRLVNRETDLGIEGLRTAKLSYNPCGFEEKFSVRFLPNHLKNG